MSYVAVLSPSNVTSCNDQYPRFTPGACVDTSDGKRYKYVQNVLNSVATTDGAICYLDDSDTTGLGYIVTSDYSECLGDTVNAVAGVHRTAGVSDGYWTFVQIRGTCTVKTNGDDDIAIGMALIGVGDGTVNSVAAGTAPTNKLVGWAIAADSDANDTVLADLCIA